MNHYNSDRNNDLDNLDPEIENTILSVGNSIEPSPNIYSRIASLGMPEETVKTRSTLFDRLIATKPRQRIAFASMSVAALSLLVIVMVTNSGSLDSGNELNGGTAASNNVANQPGEPVVDTVGFVETFVDNTVLDRFEIGVYHRDVGMQVKGQPAEIWGDNNAQRGHGGEWDGAYDNSCNDIDESRALSSTGSDFNLDEIVYVCDGHLMTSMGDVDNQSTVWVSPKKTFDSSEVSTVSWDVNVTDLGNRQWWEVVILPAGTEFPRRDSGNGPTNLKRLGSEAIVVGKAGQDGVILKSQGQDQYNDWRRVCAYDPEGCESIRPRRPFSITDNKNGTLTVDYGGMFTQDMPGTLPDQFEVFFTDQNFTPDKDGLPVGYTWHWDNIQIQ